VSTPTPARAADVPALLAALQASDPGRPRLTWYGPGGERVELSARVLDNWVAKTANLLVEELDLQAGGRVLLDLPPHWRTAVWALAAWAAGAELVARDAVDADVVVSADPARPAGDARLVLVALPGLARSVPDLPAGALDYNAEVSGFGDVFLPEEPAALPTVQPAPAGARLLVTAAHWDLAGDLVAALTADGSVVLCAPEVAADGPLLERVADDEKVTARR